MSEFLIDMGNRIYNRRKQLRMSQEQLAEAADIMPQTVSTAELGKKALRPENIVKIASALEVSADYLLRGNITEFDHSILFEKISELTPMQYQHLEEIVYQYIAAVQE